MIPKGLIEIDGETLLERSLKNLSMHGIQRAILVIGHLGDMIRGRLNEHCRGMEITYVENQKYATTGSMYSFSTAREMIQDDVLILDGDLLYDRIAIRKIVESKFENCTIITNLSGSGDEVYVCTDGNDRLTWLGKKLPDHRSPQGEFMGITKLSRRFLDRLFDEADQDYRQALSTYFFEDVVFHTNLRHDDCPVHAIYLNDLKWMDIDKESDYIRASTVLYPQLTES